MLNGQSIKDQDFPTRMFNMFSPLQFNLDGGPGRDLLFRSNYDLRTSVLSYNGISFEHDAAIRSEFQRLIGKQNLEAKLDAMAEDPAIINSINNMEAGPQSADPSKMVHNRVIGKMFKDAKDKAWATLRTRPDVKVLIEEARIEAAREFNNNQKVRTQNANRAVELSQMSN